MTGFVLGLCLFVGQPQPPLNYNDIYARVQQGQRVTFTAPLPGFPGEPGVYDCWKEGNRMLMLKRSECPGGNCPLKPKRVD